MGRHKWDFNLSKTKKVTGNNGGGITSCLKCGCVKEYVKGVVTYFLEDTVTCVIAPKCRANLKKKKAWVSEVLIFNQTKNGI